MSDGDTQAIADLTVRDYFAAKAMQECITACATDSERGSDYPAYVARIAYQMADAMLKARATGVPV